MSGPKLSQAEIERMRQEALERERQELLRKLREAQSTYKLTCNKMEDARRSVFAMMAQIDDIYKNDAQKKADAVLAALNVRAVSGNKNSEAYLVAAEAMERDVQKLTAYMEKELGIFLSRSKADQKLTASNLLHQSFQSYVSMSSDPIDVLSIDFRSNFDQQQLLKKAGQVLVHYKWTAIHGKTEPIRQYAVKAEKILRAMIDNDSVSVGQVQSIINDEYDLVRREKEKTVLYDDYLAIATLMNIVPKTPSEFHDIQAIKKDIFDLNDEFRKKDEMDYIANQINDVMIRLGYGIVTSRVLTRKDQSEVDCSLYQADDQTGIAVYTDQTGAVMMRMTVLGEDTNITEGDREFSLQRQIDFCAGHEDIVNALAEQGIYLKQKSYLPPDKRYTYKVSMKSMGIVVQKDENGQTVLKKHTFDRRRRRYRAIKKKMQSM